MAIPEQNNPNQFNQSYTKEAVRGTLMALFALGVAVGDKLFIEENSDLNFLFAVVFLIALVDAIHSGIKLVQFDENSQNSPPTRRDIPY